MSRELGLDVLELNASDSRNKKHMEQQLAEAVGSRALSLGQEGGCSLRGRVVIMDEVGDCCHDDAC